MKRSGNTVLITGGASGIGLALARELVAAGDRVVVCGRDEAKLTAAAASVPGLATFRADIAGGGDRAALVRDVRERFPELNVLVNNAGIVNVTDLRTNAFVPVLEREIATNFVAPVALAADLLEILMNNSSPTIVNVTTGYVYVPSARTAAYSATKTALHVMTQALRYQLRDAHVRVVEVMPPPVATAMSDHYNGAKTTPEKVAATILRGLRGGSDEIVIGVSKLPALFARLAPKTGFRLVNDMESKGQS